MSTGYLIGQDWDTEKWYVFQRLATPDVRTHLLRRLSIAFDHYPQAVEFINTGKADKESKYQPKRKVGRPKNDS